MLNNVGTTSIDGLISGLDTTSIIQQLVNISRTPITRLNVQKALEQQKLAAYQDLNSRLLTLKEKAAALATAGAFAGRTAESSDSDYVGVTGSPGAALGTYTVVVQKLAQAHKVRSDSFTDTTTALGLSGDIRINGRTITINAGDTLTQIKNAINSANAGVNASIQSISSTDYRLVLTANTQGADSAIDLVDANSSNLLESLGLVAATTSTKHPVTDGMRSDAFSDVTSTVQTALGLSGAPAGTVTINGQDVAIDLAAQSLTEIKDAIDALTGITATIETETTGGETTYRLQIVGDSGTPTVVDSNNVLVTLGVLTKSIAHEQAAAQDAQFTLDGETVTRGTNLVTDVLEGITLDLRRVSDPTEITITVSPNTSTALTAAKELVEAYNSIVAALNASLDYDQETETGGLFFGEVNILTLQSSLHRQTMNPVTSLGQMFTSLGHVGISTDSDGNLVLNETEFLDALEQSVTDMTRLFVLEARPSDTGNVQFVSAGAKTADSGPAGYAVHIDIAARQAVGTGINDLSGGMLVDETLTINGVAVSLTTGMSLNQVVSAINSALQAGGMGETDASHDGERVILTSEQYGSNVKIEVTSSVDNTTPGSSGLGGGTAGTKATYTGVDVVGTINGEAATGTGRILRGKEGNANTDGLVLLIKATEPGDYGSVVVSKGAAARLRDYLGVATGTDGLVDRAEESVKARIESIDEEVKRVNEYADRQEELLRAKFLALERNLARVQSIADYFALQSEALKFWTQGRYQ